MLRFALTALTAVFFVSSAHAIDLDNMSDQERAAFGQAVRDYLMENPQVIMDAVAVLEQRQQAEQAQADVALVAENRDALFNDGYSYVGGNPDGDITLVEFMDYRCGFCKRAAPEVEKLLAADGNIRLIIKEFPILGEQSMLAARFAIAAKQIAGDDAYKAVHDALISFNGDITPQLLLRLANGLDLDGPAITAAMESPEVTAEITETRALAQRLAISGTPTFVMEDELLRGFLPFDQLQQIADDKRG